MFNVQFTLEFFVMSLVDVEKKCIDQSYLAHVSDILIWTKQRIIFYFLKKYSTFHEYEIKI
jgi:hypothetical protein